MFNIVMFLSTGDWEFNTRNRSISALATEMRGEQYNGKILCVERPICPISTAVLHKRKFMEWVQGKRGVRQIEKNLYLFTPYLLIHDRVASRFQVLIKINRMILRESLKRILLKLRFRTEALITWVSHPYQLYCSGLLKEKLLVYECYDEYAEDVNIRKQQFKSWTIRKYERMLLKKADVVFATSRGLYQSRKELNQNTFFMPNGVDFEHFHNCQNHFVALEMRQIARPILGFSGSINGRIDFELLEYLAKVHPNWSIVLVGRSNGEKYLRAQKAFRKVSLCKNVHFLGGRDYQAIPQYVQAFDVCLLPLIVNSQTKKAYPLKLNEYLATGKPVVSTALPEVMAFRNVVKIGESYPDFEKAVLESLTDKNEALREKRVAIAHENSWERTAGHICGILSESLKGRI